jgi:hypothetical protein
MPIHARLQLCETSLLKIDKKKLREDRNFRANCKKIERRKMLFSTEKNFCDKI